VRPIAALAGSDPSGFVRNWRALTGGKAIAAFPPFTAPELVHSFGMLPVLAESAAAVRSFSDIVDGWIGPEDRASDLPLPAGIPFFPIPGEWPTDVADALDLLEAVAEWAGSVSGRPYSEGALRKSLAICRPPDFVDPEGEIDPLLQLARRSVLSLPKR
jgi:hypothetical protein